MPPGCQCGICRTCRNRLARRKIRAAEHRLACEPAPQNPVALYEGVFAVGSQWPRVEELLWRTLGRPGMTVLQDRWSRERALRSQAARPRYEAKRQNAWRIARRAQLSPVGG